MAAFSPRRALVGLSERDGLFLAYVLAPDDGFKGDMFVFPMKEFIELVRTADRLRKGDYRDLPVLLPQPAGPLVHAARTKLWRNLRKRRFTM